MNCERIEKGLVAYLDLRATPVERHLVEEHLGECSACRERAEAFRRVWSALDELPPVTPSASFEAKVRARIAAEAKRRVWSWLAPSPRLALAATLLLLVSLWLSSFSPSGSPAPAGPAPGSEAEFHMIQDLPVLENYDVLANFEALSDLPVQSQPAQQQSAQPE